MQTKLILALTCMSMLTAGAALAQSERPRMDPTQMMQRLDANKDGQISKAEFMKPAPQRQQRDQRDEGKRGDRQDIFDRIDRNNDGELTGPELQAHDKSRHRDKR